MNKAAQVPPGQQPIAFPTYRPNPVTPQQSYVNPGLTAPGMTQSGKVVKESGRALGGDIFKCRESGACKTQEQMAAELSAKTQSAANTKQDLSAKYKQQSDMNRQVQEMRKLHPEFSSSVIREYLRQQGAGSALQKGGAILAGVGQDLSSAPSAQPANRFFRPAVLPQAPSAPVAPAAPATPPPQDAQAPDYFMPKYEQGMEAFDQQIKEERKDPLTDKLNVGYGRGIYGTSIGAAAWNKIRPDIQQKIKGNQQDLFVQGAVKTTDTPDGRIRRRIDVAPGQFLEMYDRPAPVQSVAMTSTAAKVPAKPTPARKSAFLNKLAFLAGATNPDPLKKKKPEDEVEEVQDESGGIAMPLIGGVAVAGGYGLGRMADAFYKNPIQSTDVDKFISLTKQYPKDDVYSPKFNYRDFLKDYTQSGNRAMNAELYGNSLVSQIKAIRQGMAPLGRLDDKFNRWAWKDQVVMPPSAILKELNINSPELRSYMKFDEAGKFKGIEDSALHYLAFKQSPIAGYKQLWNEYAGADSGEFKKMDRLMDKWKASIPKESIQSPERMSNFFFDFDDFVKKHDPRFYKEKARIDAMASKGSREAMEVYGMMAGGARGALHSTPKAIGLGLTLGGTGILGYWLYKKYKQKAKEKELQKQQLQQESQQPV
jgi:hypothetical protein